MMTANPPRRARVSFPIRANRPGFIGRSFILALVVTALGLVSGRTEANEDDRYTGDVPVPLEMTDLLQRTGAARIVVVLRTPDAHRPEGTLPPGLVNAQRTQIRVAQMQVLNSLRTKSHRVLRRYETVPLLALQIGPDALTTLRTSPHVRRLVTDTMNRAFLPQSIPLIQADQVWAGGHDGSGLTVAIVD